MDFKLAKEIYSGAWCVDPITLQELSNTLLMYKAGAELKEPEQKGNTFGILAENVFTPNKVNRMESQEMDVPKNSIAQYNFDSVITKGGGASHFGTKDISAQFTQMESNPNIIGHIFKVESGGGSVNAIKWINNVANPEARTKPLVTYVEDVNGSAAYVISSNSDWIIANDKHALVGSLGTMMEMNGYKNGEKDATGKIHVRVYSDYSGEKNAEFENALNEADFTLMKENILNPSALELIEHVSKQRPNLTAKQKRAAIFRAEEAVGTLIDEIGSFDQAIAKVHELAKVKPNNKKTKPPESGDNHKSKIVSMTKEEFKAANPTAYAEIVQEGADQNQDVVEAHLVFNEIDPVKVKANIESRKPLSAKAMAEFNLQAMSGKKAEAMEKENAKETNTPKEVKTKEELQAEANKAEMDKVFNEGGE